MLVTYIYLDNYRGFKDTLVPISQVNWLVGENSTGKTSFLDILDDLGNPAFWFLEPMLGRFGEAHRHFLDLVSAASRNKSSFTIGAIPISSSETTSEDGMLVTYKNLDGKAVPARVSVIRDGVIRTVSGDFWSRKKEDVYKSKVRTCAKNAISSLDIAKKFVALHKSQSGFSIITIPDEQQWIPFFPRFSESLFDLNSPAERSLTPPSLFEKNSANLAPIRTKPRRTYDAPQTTFSRAGEHTPYLIRRRLANKSMADDFRQFLEKVGRDSGLFQSIHIKEFGKGPRNPFEVQIVLGKTALSMQNVGYGVSQALPVIVEMFVRHEGTTFMIQQPEVHLHPKAQASFGDIVADLARRDDKHFFIETHSDFAIDRFRLNIQRNGPLQSQLLYFERSEQGNTVTSIVIEKNGGIPEEQPLGYRNFFYNESLALLG